MNYSLQTLFVYYKVPKAEHAQCLSMVTKFESALKEQWPGLDIQILQRPALSAEGLETWMEVYSYPGGVTEALMTSVAQRAQAMGLPPSRATEVFVPVRH